MEIKIKPIGEISRIAICSLHVKGEQAHFIETVDECLKEADELPLWRPVGIFDGNLLIGFAMYGLWIDEGKHGKVWLDRFLLDASCQGKGYALPALKALIARIRGEYECDKLYLSVYDNNTHAIHLYKKLNFEFNGELDIGGEKVMVLNIGM